MNLNPVMDYLRDIVLPELDMALADLKRRGGDAQDGEEHRAHVVAMLEMRHGPDTMADYLEHRADRLEGIPAPWAPEEREFVEAHAPWCRRAAAALERAHLFTLDERGLAA